MRGNMRTKQDILIVLPVRASLPGGRVRAGIIAIGIIERAP